MSKFKVGDKVRVINNPNTNVLYYMDDRSAWQGFAFDMPSMAGKVVTISSVSRYGYRIKEHEWNWTDEMFSGLATEPREFIVVRRSGSEVIASHKREDEIVKTAKAKCAPSDEFDFKTGAKLAFDRLVGREEPSACKYGKLSPSGRCMVGEGMIGFAPSYQCIREKCKAHRDYKEPAPQPAPKFNVGDRVVTQFGNGTVVEINYQHELIAYTVEHDNTSDMLHSGRWDILNSPGFSPNRCYFFSEHDLSPAPEPKYYTGKVVMIACQYPDREPFIGRLFEFKNGKYVGEKVTEVCFFREPYKSFNDIVKTHSTSSWIEVKE